MCHHEGHSEKKYRSQISNVKMDFTLPHDPVSDEIVLLVSLIINPYIFDAVNKGDRELSIAVIRFVFAIISPEMMLCKCNEEAVGRHVNSKVAYIADMVIKEGPKDIGFRVFDSIKDFKGDGKRYSHVVSQISRVFVDRVGSPYDGMYTRVMGYLNENDYRMVLKKCRCL